MVIEMMDFTHTLDSRPLVAQGLGGFKILVENYIFREVRVSEMNLSDERYKVNVMK